MKADFEKEVNGRGLRLAYFRLVLNAPRESRPRLRIHHPSLNLTTTTCLLSHSTQQLLLLLKMMASLSRHHARRRLCTRLHIRP